MKDVNPNQHLLPSYATLLVLHLVLPGALPYGLAGWEGQRGEFICQGERQAETGAHHEPALLSPAISGRTAENQATEGKGVGEFDVRFWLWAQGFPVTVSI